MRWKAGDRIVGLPGSKMYAGMHGVIDSAFINRLGPGYHIIWDKYSPMVEYWSEHEAENNCIDELPSSYSSKPQTEVGKETLAKVFECDHVWKTYYGLFQTFDYCVKCDEKR